MQQEGCLAAEICGIQLNRNKNKKDTCVNVCVFVEGVEGRQTQVYDGDKNQSNHVSVFKPASR